MKKNNVIVLSLALIISLGGISLVACTRKTPSGGEIEKGGAGEISYYTCPMHPQIHEDHPGDCPICHMKLVPVYEEGTAPEGPAPGGPSVQISTERQQLIGVRTGPVEKKSVTKEIRTVGRVAFDPDLAIAQREFLEIVRNVPSLKSASVQRLRLLGMAEEEIRELQKRGKPQTNLYLPEPGESLWVYATLYQYEIPYVKIGDRAIVTLPTNQAGTAVEGEAPSGFARGGGDASPYYAGQVRSIDPVIDPMTRTARARIEVPGAGGKIKPESFLNVVLQADLGEQLTVPKPAVIDTGTRQIVFVVHEGKLFETRRVSLGPEAGEDRVIQGGLSEGEMVATSAAFLIDSESQLKAAVAGMSSTPECPEGQEWDVGMNMCMPKSGS